MRKECHELIAVLLLCWTIGPAVSECRGQSPEFRAFWADVWHTGFKSSTDIDNMVSRAVAGRYNAVIAQVLPYHDRASVSHGAYWNSNIVPKATDISGGIDPLAYMVQKAHESGIQVHVWLIPFRCSLTWPPTGNSIISAHPEWIMTTQAAMGGGPSKVGDAYLLDPGSPEVQQYLISIVQELATNYQIDGIHWDYIRYEDIDGGYPSNTSYTKSGLKRFQRITGYSGTPSTSYGPWNDFRRREITELVRRARAEIPAVKTNPRQPLRHSASLITWGTAPSTFPSTSSYQRFQNWEEWMRLGFLDTAILMDYYDETQYPSYYRSWVDRGLTWRYQRHLVIGSATYLNSFANSVTQMQYARSRGVNGLSTYSYWENKTGSINDWTWYSYVANNFFTSTATLPTMTWRSTGTATEGTLWGRVTDGNTSLPIDDATVQVGSQTAVRTDGNGFYVVTMIPASGSGTNFTVTTSASGYPTVIHNGVQVVAGDICRDDFALGGSGTPPPTITQHPQTQTATLGGTATFTVAATGQGTLTYQWQKSGNNLTDGGHYSGTTTASLTISSISADDAANYRCAVTNTGGSTISNEATLVIQGGGGLEFIVESRSGGQNFSYYSEVGGFADATSKSTATGTTAGIGSRYGSTMYAGKEATFAFEASVAGLYDVSVTWGTGSNRQTTIKYTVQHDGGSVTTNVDQTATANVWLSLGQFHFTPGAGQKVVMNTYMGVSGSAYADAVKWTQIGGTQPPVITIQPVAQDVCPGTTATFAVSATGEGTLTYQWKKNGVNLTNGGRYSGVTTPTLTIATADAAEIANYLCVVTNAGGNTSSNEAALALREVTVIAENPVSQTVCPGGTAIFEVAASGDNDLSYQWQKNGTNLSDGGHYSGTTTTMLAISSAASADVANYRCIVTADCGSATSNQAALTLDSAVITITLQPVSQTVASGGTAQFTVAVSTQGTPVYQWKKNGVNLVNSGHYSGVTTATLTITNVNSTDVANYCCAITNTCGTVTSNGASLALQVKVSADFDQDGDVDNYDLEIIQLCTTGSNLGPYLLGCEVCDFDQDNDVDQSDFGRFQRCLSGSGVSPDPNCAN